MNVNMNSPETLQLGIKMADELMYGIKNLQKQYFS